MSARAASAARCGRSCAAPNEQLSPIVTGRAWRTDAQNASTVWPDRLRPDKSVRVIEIISGSGRPSAASRFEHRLDPGLGVERVEDRLDQDEIDPALDQRVDLLAIDRLDRVEIDLADTPGSLTSGDSDSVLLVGPSAPATQRGLPSRCENRSATLRMIRAAARLIVADQAFGAVIGLADRIGVEGVGGEDVGARRGEFAGDLRDQLGPGQVEQIVIAALVLEQVEPAAIILALQPPRPGSTCRRRRP